MWRILAIVLSLWSASALAQTGTAQTKSSLNTEQSTNFADNSAGAITPAILRQTVADMIASWQQAPKVNNQVGTTYTVVADDYGKLLTFTSATAVAVTVPQATAGFSTFSFMACTQGNGKVTLTPTTSTINGLASYVLVKGQCTLVVSDGANYQALTIPSGSNTTQAPTTQIFSSGTDLTYTTPAGVTWIEVTLVGAGGGGGGGGSAAGVGGAGNPTCWKASGTACTTPLWSATGGFGGSANAGAGVSGGFVGGANTCNLGGFSGGGSGAGSTSFTTGAEPSGMGGSSTIAGGAASVTTGGGFAGALSTGAGGSGGSVGAANNTNGAGGGGGGTCLFNIASPAATYVYTVGTGGTQGTPGTSAGGGGGGGYIRVIEHYNTTG